MFRNGVGCRCKGAVAGANCSELVRSRSRWGETAGSFALPCGQWWAVPRPGGTLTGLPGRRYSSPRGERSGPPRRQALQASRLSSCARSRSGGGNASALKPGPPPRAPDLRGAVGVPSSGRMPSARTVLPPKNSSTINARLGNGLSRCSKHQAGAAGGPGSPDRKPAGTLHRPRRPSRAAAAACSKGKRHRNRALLVDDHIPPAPPTNQEQFMQPARPGNGPAGGGLLNCLLFRPPGQITERGVTSGRLLGSTNGQRARGVGKC